MDIEVNKNFFQVKKEIEQDIVKNYKRIVFFDCYTDKGSLLIFSGIFVGLEGEKFIYHKDFTVCYKPIIPVADSYVQKFIESRIIKNYPSSFKEDKFIDDRFDNVDLFVCSDFYYVRFLKENLGKNIQRLADASFCVNNENADILNQRHPILENVAGYYHIEYKNKNSCLYKAYIVYQIFIKMFKNNNERALKSLL